MIELGKTQNLVIKRFTSVGAFLNVNADTDNNTDVLLPRKYVKKDWNVGDDIEVFIYLDNSNRQIATTKKSKLELNELAILQVIDTTKIGAFMDWGLDKDLLLPFEEQSVKAKKYAYYLVGLYLDKSNRLCATMKVDKYFDQNPEYKEDDWVEGKVYAFNYDIGAFVLIDNKYNGLLPSEEVMGILKIGETVKARVKRVKPDGKIDLTFNNRMYVELNKDAETVYNILRDNGGFLKVNDKSDSRLIKSVFGMSKSQFKRSVGRLLKQRRITFKNDGIQINYGGQNGRKNFN